jgi:hypothetical protein
LGTAIGCGSAARDVDDDGGGGSTSSSTSSTGASSSSSSSSSGSGGASDCSELAPIPSAQTVDVEITNGGAADRYVMVSGQSCEPVGVERLGQSGYEGVPQSVGFQCGCECAGPLPPGPNELRHLAPGATLTVSWDARELATCVAQIDCLESYGFEGYATMTYGARVPAPSGEYRLTYQVFETVPEYCYPFGDDFACQPEEGATCTGDLPVQASFILPDSGDVSVPVTID